MKETIHHGHVYDFHAVFLKPSWGFIEENKNERYSADIESQRRLQGSSLEKGWIYWTSCKELKQTPVGGFISNIPEF